MRLSEPRIAPIDVSDADEETQKQLASVSRDGHVLRIHRTLAHHPKLLKRWMVFGGHVLRKSTLPPREREMAILRIGWLCRCEYEWSQHYEIGRQSGLSVEEIERITEGPDAPGWSPFEAALLRAVDELHADAFVGDATWKTLTEHLDTKQLLDLVFAVGQYNLVSMALNTCGVQLEEGARGFRD